MRTRGGDVAHVDLRHVGSLAAQPGQTAARLRRSRPEPIERTDRTPRTELQPARGGDDDAEIYLAKRRRALAATVLVVCPIISGLFLGAVSAVLVLGSGGVGHAIAVGALVGGVTFASNAAALCIVQSRSRAD